MLPIFHARVYASCCSSSAVGGIPRLLAHERALFTLSSRCSHKIGYFDKRSVLRKLKNPRVPHTTFEQDLLLMARVWTFLEPYLRLPMKVQISRVGTGAGLGDASFGARFLVLKESSSPELPALTLLASLAVPTGATAKKNGISKAQDILGTGELFFSLGFTVEKEIWGIDWDVGYNILFSPSLFTKSTIMPGLTHAPHFGIGFSPGPNGRFSFSIAPTFETLTRDNGTLVANSDSRKISLSGGYSHKLHSNVSINFQTGLDVPIGLLGKNTFSDVFFVVGFRFGVY